MLPLIMLGWKHLGFVVLLKLFNYIARASYFWPMEYVGVLTFFTGRNMRGPQISELGGLELIFWVEPEMSETVPIGGGFENKEHFI